MNMKDHILAALREQFKSWEELLASLSEEQIAASHFDFDWSIKDVLAHLWAWQQISIARMEAGLHDRAPELPMWIVESVENWEEDSDLVNALTFARNHQKSIRIGEVGFCNFSTEQEKFLKETCWMEIDTAG